ncbi:MAG: DUF3090 family protein [Actinobacteria bacterium]|nr:DUF3090 family protein [Actinomycetota bacterium]
MNPSFEFDSADHFTAGAIGEPGHRAFFLQIGDTARTVSLKCEKEQVGALAEYLAGVLADLPPVEPVPVDVELRSPVEAAWIAGTLSVGYDEVAQQVVLVIEELVPDADEDGPDEAASLRARLGVAQVAAYVAHAGELIAAGRPPCPLCGRPSGADHVCVRSNGHGPPR